MEEEKKEEEKCYIGLDFSTQQVRSMDKSVSEFLCLCVVTFLLPVDRVTLIVSKGADKSDKKLSK